MLSEGSLGFDDSPFVPSELGLKGGVPATPCEAVITDDIN